MARPKLPGSWQRLRNEERRQRAVRRNVRALVAGTRLVPAESAKVAELRYVSDVRMPGIRRLGRGKRFRYVDDPAIVAAHLAGLPIAPTTPAIVALIRRHLRAA